MKWRKEGLIFDPVRDSDWMKSHAQIPFAESYDDRLRIYFSTRDDQGRSNPTYIEVSADEPSKILYVHDRPILPLGERGTFDDNGIMPSWIVNHEDKKYLYYIGWNPEITTSYRLGIGLAISDDGGETFEKYAKGPIIDRSINEPFWVAAPSVIKEDDLWRMWYISCTGWDMIHDHPEPHYNVKYAESNNGHDWTITNKICIDYDDFIEAIGRPCVYRDDGLYKMLYSYRGATDYRSDPATSYRLGYAESKDGLDWERKDHLVGIERSTEGWDSQMIAYCHVYFRGEEGLLFYNGNGFGQSGIGYAVLEKDG